MSDSGFWSGVGASLLGALIGSIVGPHVTLFLKGYAARRDSLRGALGELTSTLTTVGEVLDRAAHKNTSDNALRRDDAIYPIQKHLGDGSRFDMSLWSIASVRAAKAAFAASTDLRDAIAR